MIVDNIKLLKMLNNGQIKVNTKIKRTYKNLKDTYVYTGCNLRNIIDDKEITSEKLLSPEATYELESELDIQSIQEIDLWAAYNASTDKNIIDNRQKINEVIKAIKQLDKKIK